MKKIRIGRKVKKLVRKAGRRRTLKKWGTRAAIGVAAAGAAAAAVVGARRARGKTAKKATAKKRSSGGKKRKTSR